MGSVRLKLLDPVTDLVWLYCYAGLNTLPEHLARLAEISALDTDH